MFTVSLYGASASRDEPAYLWSQPMQVYTDFASAFENLFQRAASQWIIERNGSLRTPPRE